MISLEMELPKRIGFLSWNFTWKAGFSISHRHRFGKWYNDLKGVPNPGRKRYCKTKSCNEFEWKTEEYF